MIKQAQPGDLASLRRLAHDSEAHWGGSPAFMEAYDQSYNITADFLFQQPVYVLWDNGTPAAFWGLEPSGDGWELAFFYVEEALLGRGLGRQLWQHLTGWCREHGIDQFRFVTSPEAAAFYKKMGAVQERLVPSVIDGRPIPRFKYDVS